MKKLLSVFAVMTVILSISSCAEGQNAPAEGTVNVDTTASAANVPETTVALTTTVADTTTPFETTSAAFTTSDGIVYQTTEGYTEEPNALTTSSTTKSIVVSDDTGMYVPGYDPGMPYAWFNMETTEIYSDTEKIIFTLNTENEFGTGLDFIFQKRTENGWENLQSSVCYDSWATVNKDNPLKMELNVNNYGITLEAGCEYRIAKNIDGKEYETFFIVGHHNTPLKREDISLYLADTDWLTEDNLHNLTIKYTYVGNAEYADYGFGCEYTLQKRNEKDEWVNVPFSEDAAFIELGYLIGTESPNQSTTVYLNNDFYAEPLTAGTYRIIKPVEDIEYTLLFRINEKYNCEAEPAKNDISMSIDEVEKGVPITTETDRITINFRYTGEDDYAVFGYGSYSALEKYENGKWREVKYADNMAWTDLLYIISHENRETSESQTLKDEHFAEPITAGKYRFKKTISESKNFYAEFEIIEAEPLKATVVNKEKITTKTRYIEVEIEYTGDEKNFEYEFPLTDEAGYFEKMENGKWKRLALGEDECFDEGSIKISPENKKISIRYDADFLSEPLTEGRYRIVQKIDNGSEVYAPFEMINGDLFIVKHSGTDFGVQIMVDTDDDRIDLDVIYNGNEEEFEYEFNMASYYIEKLEENGNWKRFTFRDDIAFCDGIDIILPEQRSFTRSVELGDSYTEPVTAGKYRAVIYSYQGVDAVFEFEVFEALGGHEKFNDLVITLENNKIDESTKYKTLAVQYEYTGDDPDADFWIYNDFEVQKLDEDGRWQNYPFSKKIKFSEDVIRIDSKNTKGHETLKLNDEYFKEPLKAGKYRIVKAMCDCTNKYIEFQVTGTGISQGSGTLTLTINEITDNSFVCSLPWPYPAVYTVEISDTDLLDEYCAGDTIEVDYGNMYQRSEWDYLIVDAKISQSSFQLDVNAEYKPVIYLYPEEKTDVSVKLDYNGELTVTYPEYGDGWNVTAMPDGTLYDRDGNEYSYLFWEGKSNVRYDFSEGFCVKGEDTADFLRTALKKLGLTPREYNEFIVFWLPFMQDNEYNVISFQYDCYTDNAVLSVTPEPDTVLRVFMAYYPSDKPVEISEQELEAAERQGFTVVEWGGTIQSR